MKHSIIIALIFIFLLIGTVFAEVSISAGVDKTTVAAGETLTYKLIITSSEKKIPNPKIPEFKGFDIVSSTQSSTISFAKEGVKTNLIYTFILSPVSEGKLEIEAGSAEIKGKIYATEVFTIDVTKGKFKPFPKLEPKEKPETEEPQITL